MSIPVATAGREAVEMSQAIGGGADREVDDSSGRHSARRPTGMVGLAASLILLTTIPLYFVVPDPPPQWVVLTRVLISIVGCSLLLVFLVGFRIVLLERRLGLEWAATVTLVSGLLFLAFALVAKSMEAGTAIVSPVPIESARFGALAPGQFLLWGSIGRAMATLFLSAAGLAILRGRLMPAWFGRLAWILAAVNLAFVPSIYFGPDSTHFYSANGWGTTATIPGLVVCWILVASAILLRRPRESGS